MKLQSCVVAQAFGAAVGRLRSRAAQVRSNAPSMCPSCFSHVLVGLRVTPPSLVPARHAVAVPL